MSVLEVNKLTPLASNGTVTMGDSGDTISIPSGVTIANAGTATGFGGAFESQLLHIRDEKSSGTGGGSSSAGSWQTRTLNTVKTNEIANASLSSNRVSLPSGTYYIMAKANIFDADRHKIKLRNITDSSDELIGSSEYAEDAYNGTTNSYIHGRFTISGTKVFEIQHRNEVSGSFGIASSFGVVEVFADVQIWKVA